MKHRKVGDIKYAFRSEVTQYSGKGGWFFVSLPVEYTKEIREYFRSEEEGWGRLKARATIGDSTWETSIWFDTKKRTYMLPIKVEIRKMEGLEKNKIVTTILWVLKNT
ncbi:MAG: DUF1905 domain-containing protein [Cytophagaceae bacterium]|nr:DUF1905 domain-containing protein [Cytophagaceae bacterium]